MVTFKTNTIQSTQRKETRHWNKSINSSGWHTNDYMSWLIYVCRYTTYRNSRHNHNQSHHKSLSSLLMNNWHTIFSIYKALTRWDEDILSASHWLHVIIRLETSYESTLISGLLPPVTNNLKTIFKNLYSLQYIIW